MVEEKETGRRGREGGGDRKRWEEVRALFKRECSDCATGGATAEGVSY